MENINRTTIRPQMGAIGANATTLRKFTKIELAARSHQTSIGFQMRKTYRMLEQFIQQKLARHDIQIGMWYFLRTLWIEDGLTQRELANRVGTTEPTALEQLRKMEVRGLVLRRRDPSDRRKSTVFLTAQGKRLKHVALPYIEELNAAAFGDFTVAERKQLEQYLVRIRRNLRPKLS